MQKPVSLIFASSTDDVLARGDAIASVLTYIELQRSERFLRTMDRADYLAAHIIVRLCAAELLQECDWPLTLVQRCPHCGGAHGRPIVAEAPHLNVSLSHTRGYVAAAAGYHAVGVDVERIRHYRFGRDLMESSLSPEELSVVLSSRDQDRAFLRQWVRKEAFVKLGVASLNSLSELDLSDLPQEPAERVSYAKSNEWREWNLLDWYESSLEVVGAAVARGPLKLSRTFGDRDRRDTN